jgi:DNA-binding transcriptional ArsR family regulator
MKKPEKSEVEMTLDDSFLDSERAVEVLKRVHQSEDPTYATELARNHDLDRSTASRILSKLEARRLVERAERDKAIRYQVNYEGMAGQTLNIVGLHHGLEFDLKSQLRENLDDLNVQENIPMLRDFLIVPLAMNLRSVDGSIHTAFFEALGVAELLK